MKVVVKFEVVGIDLRGYFVNVMVDDVGFV